MTKYRKKPVEVDALQFEGTVLSANEILAWIGIRGADASRVHNNRPSDGLVVHTLEGDMLACPGDWVIRGVQGEFYPCKPDIFDATYEKVES